MEKNLPFAPGRGFPRQESRSVSAPVEEELQSQRGAGDVGVIQHVSEGMKKVGAVPRIEGLHYSRIGFFLCGFGKDRDPGSGRSRIQVFRMEVESDTRPQSLRRGPGALEPLEKIPAPQF